VDGARVFAYGNSMGAFLTIGLAGTLPESVRAAAITSGGIGQGSGGPGAKGGARR
jgi:pimeloyl-ACP methyl ester carboxylesterase